MGAQKRIAKSCRTTILTVADPAIHMSPVLERALASLKGAAAGERRYDLLTTTRPGAFVETDDPDTIGLYVADIKMAVALHNGERLVVAVRGNPRDLVERFRGYPGIADGGLIIEGLDLNRFTSEREEPTSAVVSCMDWRQHGSQGGLMERVVRSYGIAPYALLATAGGAKEIADPGLRGNTVVVQLQAMRRLQRVILTVHADCGKYGGSEAFDGKLDQIRRLSADLVRSAVFLKEQMPKLDVETAIVHLTHGRIERLAPPLSVA